MKLDLKQVPARTRPPGSRPFVASGSIYAYGGYPDIDGLFREQVGELDRKKREAILHRVQQLIHEKAMYAPIWELGFTQASVSPRGGVGPRAHHRLSLVGALRRREAEGEIRTRSKRRWPKLE